MTDRIVLWCLCSKRGSLMKQIWRGIAKDSNLIFYDDIYVLGVNIQFVCNLNLIFSYNFCWRQLRIR